MDRTKFYTKLTTDSVEELDFLWNSITEIKLTYNPGFYRVAGDDLMRPDLISYKVYGTVAYWWVVMVQNGIEDPFLDLEVGELLTIPNILDIYTFFKEKRVRT